MGKYTASSTLRPSPVQVARLRALPRPHPMLLRVVRAVGVLKGTLKPTATCAGGARHGSDGEGKLSAAFLARSTRFV